MIFDKDLREGLGLLLIGVLCTVFGVLLVFNFPNDPWWMIGIWVALALLWVGGVLHVFWRELKKPRDSDSL